LKNSPCKKKLAISILSNRITSTAYLLNHLLNRGILRDLDLNARTLPVLILAIQAIHRQLELLVLGLRLTKVPAQAHDIARRAGRCQTDTARRRAQRIVHLLSAVNKNGAQLQRLVVGAAQLDVSVALAQTLERNNPL